MKRLVLFSLLFSLVLQPVTQAQTGQQFNGFSSKQYFTDQTVPNDLNYNFGSKKQTKEEAFVSNFFYSQKKDNKKTNSIFMSNPLKCDDNGLFADCAPEISRGAMDLSRNSLDVTMTITGAACYNNPRTCEESTPDLQNICGCLNLYGGMGSTQSQQNVDTSNLNPTDKMIERGVARVQEFTNKILTEKLPDLNKCAEILIKNPKDEECLALVKKAESLNKSGVAKKSGVNLVAGGPKQINHMKSSCLSEDEYLKATHIPTPRALEAITPPSKNRDEITAHKDVIMGLLEGKSLSDLNMTSYPVMKSVINKMNSSLGGMELEIFIKKNRFWSVLVDNAKNDQKKKKGILEKFTDILGSGSPEYRAKELNDFMNEPETKAAIIKAAEDELKESDEKISMLGQIKSKKPDFLYSDYRILNKMYVAEKAEEVTPTVCSIIALEAEGRRAEHLGPERSSFLTVDNIMGCRSMYQSICEGNKRWRDGQSVELSEAERKVIDEFNDKDRLDSYYTEFKKDQYKKQATKICTEPHSLGKGFEKLGRGITFNEFKEVVCSGKEIDKERINYKFADDDIKQFACGSNAKADETLGKLYIAAFDENSSPEIADIKQMSIEDTDPVVFKKKAKEIKFLEEVENNYAVSTNNSDSEDEYCGIMCALGKMRESSKGPGAVAGASPSGSSTAPTFIDGLASGMTKAATTISGPAVESNVQSYVNGVMPITSVLPADLNNADPSQLSYAKRSVDNGISDLEKRLDNYEKKEEKSYSASQNQEISLLKKQIEELRQQSELLKSQLDKEKETKVADKAVESPAAVAGSRSPASTGDYKSSLPTVSSATQQAANNQNLQPSKIFENSYSDGSFHNVPTLGSSKSIDSKAFNSRSSNDALLSIYTDKTVSNLVDAVASSSNSNILVVGNALEMQEATVKDKKFQTKEIVIDQSRLEQVRSNPESLKNLIEENKIKNHVGILTLKTGESQLNYIMRKDDSGKLVILPLNIARKVTLDSLKNELISN